MAVRRPDGTIHLESHERPPKSSWLGSTIARGLVALADAVSVGVHGMRIAVAQSTGVEATAGQLGWTFLAAAMGAVAVFIAGPGLLVATWPDATADVLEAALRAAMLVLYFAVLSRSSSAARIFAYHGAEHKVIAAYELNGRMPALDDARPVSPIHRRCGTSFVALLVIVSGIVHSFVPRHPLWSGALLRVALLPLDAVLAYELLRATARRPALGRVLGLPGRLLQRLTTREPTDDQLAVALTALRAIVS